MQPIKKTQLRNSADLEISWLEDAKDLGDATPEELALLERWKKYRVALMRVDAKNGNEIMWPEF